MKILITVPTEGKIHKHVVFVLLRLQRESRHQLRIILPTHRPYENNLHHIVNDFMESDEDYWLNIDADNPPINNPLDLVALDLDIIGLPTPVWHFTEKITGERPVYLNVYRRSKTEEGYNEWNPKEGLQEVDAVGTGCFLIARRVFEDRWMREAPFQRTYNKDGTVNFGNDLAFCARAKKNGFKVHAHFDYCCLHFSEIEISEVTRAFMNMRA